MPNTEILKFTKCAYGNEPEVQETRVFDGYGTHECYGVFINSRKIAIFNFFSLLY